MLYIDQLKLAYYARENWQEAVAICPLSFWHFEMGILESRNRKLYELYKKALEMNERLPIMNIDKPYRAFVRSLSSEEAIETAQALGGRLPSYEDWQKVCKDPFIEREISETELPQPLEAWKKLFRFPLTSSCLYEWIYDRDFAVNSPSVELLRGFFDPLEKKRLIPEVSLKFVSFRLVKRIGDLECLG